MSAKDEIKKAMGVHGMWKARLSTAIDFGKSEFSVDAVQRDNACDFGRWLHGASIPEAAKRMAEYETCRRLHADFHRAAADVLKLAIAGQKAQAQNALASSSKFAAVSADLTTNMMKWMAAAERAGI